MKKLKIDELSMQNEVPGYNFSTETENQVIPQEGLNEIENSKLYKKWNILK